MGDTKIEWTDKVWNPVRGCSRISAGCGGANHQGGCYAEKIAARFSGPGQAYEGLAERTAHGGRWTGVMRLVPEQLDVPLRWRRPRRIFVNSMSDLFHENLPIEAIDQVMAVIALAPRHVFQVLTKRADRMRRYMTDPDAYRRILQAASVLRSRFPHLGSIPISDPRQAAFWPQLWLGVSVEDQAAANTRIPHLLATPSAVRFLSCEPLLGPTRVDDVAGPDGTVLKPLVGLTWRPSPEGMRLVGGKGPRIDWVICGGESGPRARPMHPDWARDLRDQCVTAGVPFFFKQFGTFGTVYDRNVEDPDWRRCSTVERQTPHGQWLNLAGGQGFHGDRVVRVDRMGKKQAGRTLDGRTWDQFPEAA